MKTSPVERPNTIVGLQTFVVAYNFARRLKTLRGLTPFEHIVRCWTDEPVRFIHDPTHHMLGLNN